MEDTVNDSPRPRLRRRPRRALVVGLLAMLTLVAGVTVGVGPAGAEARPKYSGEDLITGFVYGLGPVAKAYPQLRLGHDGLMDPKGTAEFLPKLYEEAERRSPGFRRDFGEAMYSGNRVRIQQSIVYTARLLGDALVTLIPELEPVLRRHNSDANGDEAWYYENEAVWADAYAVIEFALSIGAVVALTVALSLIDFTPDQPDPGSFAAATLLLERWSHTVASTLSAR
jgi:SdpC family antimicrobial peptide